MIYTIIPTGIVVNVRLTAKITNNLDNGNYHCEWISRKKSSEFYKIIET